MNFNTRSQQLVIKHVTECSYYALALSHNTFIHFVLNHFDISLCMFVDFFKETNQVHQILQYVRALMLILGRISNEGCSALVDMTLTVQ